MEKREFQEVWNFLSKLDLKEYYEKFIEYGFDSLEMLQDLDEEALNEMEVDEKHKLILLSKVKDFSQLKEKEEEEEESNSTDFRGDENKRKQELNKKVKYKLYENSYGVIIGINDYKNEKALKGSLNDAKEMKIVLEKMEVKVLEPLFDKKATKSGIEEKFDEIKEKLKGKNEKETKKLSDSLLIIYFAGHGYEDETGQQKNYYLCPQDFDKTKINSTGINLLELRLKASALNCKHILFILDCCFSGGIFENEGEIKLNNSILVNSFLKGIWAISAGGKELVKEQEFEGKRRGVFTYFLQQALTRVLDDEDKSLFNNENQTLLQQKSRR